MAPKKFGKYEVLARLATGGAANIFLARQPGAAGFHKLVCLKTLLPERATDGDFVAMFLDEARLAARLNHPNCVQIYDLGRVGGSFYISMEYIFGETLWNLLATVTKLRTPLPAPQVASIISSVCDGLHHAHELKDANGRPFNLVHRDVSPQNVMVTFEGQTKVVDFGIAKAETGRAPTVAGIVKGKFSYMSPEQITGSTIDRRSDVYSLGIVLFECLASRRLYRGDTPEDIARLILEHRAPRLKDVVPDIPPPLDSICATALSRHPSKRYQSAHEMGEALRDYLDGVRYNHSAGVIAKLVEDRFKGQIPERRKVFESALSGSYDEAHLLKVLDARVARDIDLFPEDQNEGSADHGETSGLIDAGPLLLSLVMSGGKQRETVSSSETIHKGDETTGDVTDGKGHASGPNPLVRVAVFEAGAATAEGRAGDAAEEEGAVDGDATCIDQKALHEDYTEHEGFEAKEGDSTNVDLEHAPISAPDVTIRPGPPLPLSRADMDPSQVPALEAKPRLTLSLDLPSSRPGQKTAPEPAAVLSAGESPSIPKRPVHALSGARASSSVSVGAAQNRVGPTITRSALPRTVPDDPRAAQVRQASYGGAAAIVPDTLVSLEPEGDLTGPGSSGELDKTRQEETFIDVAQAEEDRAVPAEAEIARARGDSPRATAPVIDPLAATANVAPTAVVDEQPGRTTSGAGPSEPARRSTAITETSLLDARFGSASLLAALGFGIATGIILGLLLARVFYAPQLAQVIPVSPSPNVAADPGTKDAPPSVPAEEERP